MVLETKYCFVLTLNTFNYTKTFTILEDHYFQEQLERFQTPFTVYNFNTMYTSTFTLMSFNKTWLYGPLRNPLHNLSAHYHVEFNWKSVEKFNFLK